MVNLFYHLVLLIYHNSLTNGLIIKGQRGTENIYLKVVLIGKCKYENIEAGEKKNQYNRDVFRPLPNI